MPLGKEDIAALSETTEDWVAGLVLFYLAMKGREADQVRKAIRESGLSLPAVFEYLSRAAYDNQPEEVREFVLKTSVLSRVSPEFADELLGRQDSRSVLTRLVSDRLFTVPLDNSGSWYRYHHGLQTCLRTRLAETLTKKELRELHLRAAAIWEGKEQPEEALPHFFAARDFGKAATTLEGIAEPLMKANRISYLYNELSLLPEKARKEHPMLMLFDLTIASFQGDFSRVIEAASAAVDGYDDTRAEERASSSAAVSR